MPREPSGPISSEKRQHLRVDYNVPVKISSDQVDILTETKNISCSGAYCRMTQRLEPMTKLKVHLLLPLRKRDMLTTKSITCQGVVVRTQAVQGQESYDTAIFFSDIAPKDIRTINDFIDSVTANKDNGKYN